MQLNPDLVSTTVLWLAWALTLPAAAFVLAAIIPALLFPFSGWPRAWVALATLRRCDAIAVAFSKGQQPQRDAISNLGVTAWFGWTHAAGLSAGAPRAGCPASFARRARPQANPSSSNRYRAGTRNSTPSAASDAAEVAWYPLNALPALAFDHADIIAAVATTSLPPSREKQQQQQISGSDGIVYRYYEDEVLAQFASMQYVVDAPPVYSREVKPYLSVIVMEWDQYRQAVTALRQL